MRMETPRTRIRVGHAYTIKEGWQHETTVEMEWSDYESEDNLALLRGALFDADNIARAERNRRNELDGRARISAVA